MASNGRFEYTIGFKTDDKGLREAHKALQETRKALQEIQNLTINSPGMSDKSGFLENAKKSAAELELALTKAYNVKMGTTSIAKLNIELNNLKTPLNKIYEDMAAIGPKGEAAFNKIAAQAMKTNLQIKQGNTILNKFGKTLWRNVEWLISGNLINTVTGVFTKAYGYTKNLDESLNNIRIVTGKGADEMARFGKEAQETAEKLGKGTTDITNASLIFYQQGLDKTEVDARTEVATKLANVSQQSAETTADQLTAVWNGFQAGTDDLEHYADVMTAIAANTASSSSELAGAISKVSSVAHTTGVDMEQLSAMISTVISVTRDSPETVGTAFKTIFARMDDLVEDGTDEFGVSLGRVSSHLAAMGIQILDEDGKLRDLGDTLTETGEKWSSYSREQQIAIAEQMGGKRQWNQVLALFDNWDKYRDALDVAKDSTGALQDQQDIYMESTQAHLQAVKTAWEGVYGEMMTADNINTVADFFTDLLEKVQSFIQAVGGMKPLLTSVAGILMTSFSSQIGQSIGNIALNFQKMLYNARELSAQNQLTAQFGKLESPLMEELADNHQRILQYQSSMTDQQRKQYESLLDIRVEAENEYKVIKEQDDALKDLLTKYEQIGEIQKQNNSLSETTDAIQQRAGALETMRGNEGFETKTGRLVSLDWTDNDHKQTIDSLKIVNAIEQEIVKRQEQAIKLKEQMAAQTGKQKEATRKQAKEEETIVKYLREAADIARENAHRRATEKGNPSLPSKAAKTIEEVQQKIKNKYQGNHDDIVDLVKNLNDVLGKTNKPAESAKQKIDLIQQSLKKLGEQGALAKEDVQKLTDKYTAFGQTITNKTSKETLTEGFEKLKQEVLATGAVSEEEFAKMIQMLQDGVPQAADTSKARLESAKKATKEFFEQLDFQNKIKNITTAIGAVGQLAGAIQSIKNLGSIWDNKDLTTGEKLLQTVQNLGFVIPMLTTSVMNLTKSLFANAGALTVEMLDEKGVVLQKGAHLTITQLLTIAQVALNAALKANPIGLVITAIAALVLAMKGLLSILNKATKATGGWRAATVALSTCIGALFLGPIGAAIGLTAGLIANFWQLKDAEEAERKAMVESSKARIEANKEILEAAKAQKEAIQTFKDAYDAYENDRTKLNELSSAIENFKGTLSNSEQKQLDHLKHIADITGNYEALRKKILGVEEAINGTENKILEADIADDEVIISNAITEGKAAEGFKNISVNSSTNASEVTGGEGKNYLTIVRPYHQETKTEYGGVTSTTKTVDVAEGGVFVGTYEEAQEYIKKHEKEYFEKGKTLRTENDSGQTGYFVDFGSGNTRTWNLSEYRSGAGNSGLDLMATKMADRLLAQGVIDEDKYDQVKKDLLYEINNGNLNQGSLRKLIQKYSSLDGEAYNNAYSGAIAGTMKDWEEILYDPDVDIDPTSMFYKVVKGAINYSSQAEIEDWNTKTEQLKENEIDQIVNDTTEEYASHFKNAAKMSKGKVQEELKSIYTDLIEKGMDPEEAKDQAEQIVRGFFEEVEGGMTDAANEGIVGFNNGEIVKNLVNGENIKDLKKNFEKNLKKEMRKNPITINGKEFYVDVENLDWEQIQLDIDEGRLKKEDIFDENGQLIADDTKSLQILASYSQEYQNLGNNVAITTTNFEQLNGTIDSLNEKIEKKNIKNLDKDSDWKALQESESDLRILFKDNEEMLEKMDILFDPSKYGTDEWYEAFHRVADGIRSSGTIEAFNEMSKVENDFLNEHRTIQEEIGGKTDFQVKMEVDGDEYEDYMEKITDADYKVNVQVQVENSRELKDLKNELNSTIGLAGKIGEGFIVSRDDLFELAEAYPALLKNAQHMTDGTIKLNEASVKDFIDAKKKEFQAEVKAKRQKILAQIEILKHKKETYDKMADIGARMASGEIDTEEDLVEVTGQLDAHNEDLKIANHYLTNQEDSKLMEANVDDFNKSGKKIVDSNRSFWQRVVDDRAAILSGQAVTDSYNPDDFKWSSDSWDDLIGFLDRKDLGNRHYLADYWGAINEIKNRGQDIYDKFHKLSEETQGLIDDESASLDGLNLYEKAGLDAFNNIGKVTDATKDNTDTTKDNTDTTKDNAEAQAELLDLLNDEIDAYHDINIAIEKNSRALSRLQKEQSHLTGNALIKNLEKQEEVLKKQNQDLQEKQRMQYEEAALHRGELASHGVTFNEDGTIANYNSYLNKIQEELNKEIEKYNAMSAEEQEAHKDHIEAIKQNYEDEKDLIKKYDTLINDSIEDLADEIEENAQEQLNKIFEKLNAKVQITVDKGSIARANLELEKIENHLQDSDLFGNLAYSVKTLFSYEESGEGQALLDRYLEASARLGKYEGTGIDPTAEEVEFYNASLEAYKKYLEERAELQTTIVSSSFDQLLSRMEKQKGRFDTVMKIFDRDINIVKLRYGEDSAEQLQALYDAKTRASDAQLKNANLQIEALRAELDRAVKNNLGEDLIQELQDKLASALDEQSSLIESHINLIQESADNAIDAVFDHMDQQIAGMSLDDVKTEWSKIQEDADDYYDAINGAYEIDKLRNKMKQAINNTDDVGTQKSLNSLMSEEIANLQQKDKLSKYDIDRANALFDIEQKRAAFREAQNNKSKMRLRKDSSGNYSYQFVSDEDKVTSAMQDLADAQNSLYNIDKEGYKSNLDKMAQYYEQFQEDLKNASTEEERQKIVEEYSDKFRRIQEENAYISRNLQNTTLDEYGRKVGETFKDISQIEKDALMNDLVPYWGSAWAEMARNEDYQTLIHTGAAAIEKIREDAKNKQDQALDSADNSVGDLTQGIDKTAESILGMTESMGSLTNELKLLIGVLGEVSQMMTGGTFDSEKLAQLMNNPAKVIDAYAEGQIDSLIYSDSSLQDVAPIKGVGFNPNTMAKPISVAYTSLASDWSKIMTVETQPIEKERLINYYEEFIKSVDEQTKFLEIQNKYQDNLKELNEQMSRRLSDGIAIWNDILDKITKISDLESLRAELETKMRPQVNNITANFPNVSVRQEIEAAFQSLTNMATQHAYTILR